MERDVLPDNEQAAHQLTMEQDKYVLVDGVLHRVYDGRKGRFHLCVPVEMRESLMSGLTRGGLLGISHQSVHNKLAQ